MQDGIGSEVVGSARAAAADGDRARTPAVKAATPVDVHIGQRLRLRRKLVGLSQEQLAERLGITFQQVQKYEKGSNRISASRLFDAARLLSVPVSFFFEGLAASEADPEQVTPMTRDEYDLLLAFRSAKEDVRRPLVALVQASREEPERAAPSRTGRLRQSRRLPRRQKAMRGGRAA
jgi:transcriptional regulator with XRE-family HTH domain